MSAGILQKVTDVFQPDGQELPSIDEDLDELWPLFRTERRRLAIQIIASEGDAGITTADMAEYIAAIEEGVQDGDVEDRSAYKRVYVSLYQTHLPKLAREGVIEWEKGSNSRPNRRTEQLAELLGLLDRIFEGGAVDAE